MAGEGPGEGTFLVAEKLAFEKVFRDGGAVYGEEKTILAWAVVVDALCEKFFSGPAFPVNENSGVRGGSLSHDREDGSHAAVIAHDVVQMELVEELVLEHQVVAKEPDLNHCVVEHQKQMVLFEGLFEIMECTKFGRFDG